MKKALALIYLLMLGFSFTTVYAAGSATSLSAFALKSREVINYQSEVLGKIRDVVLDHETNQVSIVMISGDEVGLGKKLIPVPVTALTLVGDNIVLDMSKSQLALAPSYERSELPSVSDPVTHEQSYRYFGIQPQWELQGPNMKSFPSCCPCGCTK